MSASYLEDEKCLLLTLDIVLAMPPAFHLSRQTVTFCEFKNDCGQTFLSFQTYPLQILFVCVCVCFNGIIDCNFFTHGTVAREKNRAAASLGYAKIRGFFWGRGERIELCTTTRHEDLSFEQNYISVNQLRCGSSSTPAPPHYQFLKGDCPPCLSCLNRSKKCISLFPAMLYKMLVHRLMEKMHEFGQIYKGPLGAES